MVYVACFGFTKTQVLMQEERWEETCGQRDSELSRVLMEHLVTRSATARNAALPTLVVSLSHTNCHIYTCSLSLIYYV